MRRWYELWSHHLILLMLSVKHLLTFNLTQVAFIAISSVWKVVVEALLACPVSETVSLLLSIFFLYSIVEVFGVLNAVVLLAKVGFLLSLGLLYVFGSNSFSVFEADFIVDEITIVTFLPFFVVIRCTFATFPSNLCNLIICQFIIG